jgi:PAS domain S-box-containing protein
MGAAAQDGGHGRDACGMELTHRFCVQEQDEPARSHYALSPDLCWASAQHLASSRQVSVRRSPKRGVYAMAGLPETEVDGRILVGRPTDDIARYLAAIVDSSDDAIISVDVHGIMTSWNKGAERLFGYAFAETVGKPVTILLPSDRQDEEKAILQRISRGRRVDHYETVRQRKDGGLIDVSLTVSPVRDGKGQIVGASKIARDITARKHREAQMAILAREAEHRAKNLLSVVQAIVQLSYADTPEGLKGVIAERIRALASVVSLFTDSRWTGAELHALIAQELSPYDPDGGALCRFDGPELILDPDTAQALALIIHELARNAAKYGALSVPNGRLGVSWSRTQDDQVLLRWIETGGPHVQPSKREGFGTRLMKGLIGDRLKGTIRFDWRTEGLVCEIAFSHRGSG